MTTALWVFTCLVRWPISTIAQQVLFSGWLQPRLRRHRVAVAAILYAGSHVCTPRSSRSVPLGFLFACPRRRTGRIYAGVATHYVINVALDAAARR